MSCDEDDACNLKIPVWKNNMTKVVIKRAHGLSKFECQRLSEEVADVLVQSYGGSKKVTEGEVLYKHASGSKGVLSYTDDHFKVEVKLSLLMRPMAKLIKSEVERQFDKRL